jgi:hypothetical protein
MFMRNREKFIAAGPSAWPRGKIFAARSYALALARRFHVS